jgi:membrane protein DedA with SNARE-associated domain
MVLAAGVVGESFALIALYRQAAGSMLTESVLACVLLLLVAVSGNLFWYAVGRDYYAWLLKRSLKRSEPESTASTSGSTGRQSSDEAEGENWRTRDDHFRSK